MELDRERGPWCWEVRRRRKGEGLEFRRASLDARLSEFLLHMAWPGSEFDRPQSENVVDNLVTAERQREKSISSRGR